MSRTSQGRCLCGDVSFEVHGDPIWVGHCHCETCRRGAGAPLVTFAGYRNNQWAWTKATPSVYVSSPGAKRYFCARCGSSVAFESVRFPDEFHFHVALFDTPEDLEPNELFHAEERLKWMPALMPGCLAR
ncbi:MAG: GFA family protein [Pseudomonadota bacterium]